MLQELICCFSDINKCDHETHFLPYINLSPLTSHIHLHFVVFNSGKKLSSTLVQHIAEIIITLSQTVPHSDAFTMVVAMQHLYREWSKVDVPKEFYDTMGTPKRFHRLSDEGRDDRSQGGPPRHQGLRSVTHSQG